MSYIRSGSNPEKLYVWGGKDFINITGGTDSLKQIPIDTFEEILNTFIDNFYEADEPIIVDEFKLEERWTNEDALSENLHDLKRVDRGEYKVFLSCEEPEWEIEMWRVTWMYIVHHHEVRERKELKGDSKCL